MKTAILFATTGLLTGLLFCCCGSGLTSPAPTNPIPLPTSTIAPIPTDTPRPSPTDTPVLALPTDTPPPAPMDTPIPEPTPSPPAEAQVIIVTVNKKAEYVDIQNTGGTPQDLTGWHLLSEKGEQDCPLGGIIQPGETLRIWARLEDAGQGGYNCGYDTNIWNNQEQDLAILFDATGNQVDRK